MTSTGYFALLLNMIIDEMRSIVERSSISDVMG